MTFQLALLRSCRQIYHEAKYILWTTNTFSFSDPDCLWSFMHNIKQTPAANTTRIRKLHLHVAVRFKPEEYAWNTALRAACKKLTGLTRVYVSVDQQYVIGDLRTRRYRWRRHLPKFQPFSDPNTGRKGKNTFLKGLYDLKELPIETVNIVVYSTVMPDANEGGWTHAQKQVWARYVRDVIPKLDQ